MKKLLFLLILLLLPIAHAQQAIDTTGRWSGIWSSLAFPGEAGEVKMDLVQKGMALSGSMIVLGGGCAGSKAPFTGLAQQDMSFQIKSTVASCISSGDTGYFVAKGSLESLTKMSGFYQTLKVSGQVSDSGTFTMYKESATPITGAVVGVPAVYITSVNYGHSHQWSPGQDYTSTVLGHNHPLDEANLIAKETSGHTHQLLKVTEAEVGRTQGMSGTAMLVLVLVVTIIGGTGIWYYRKRH